MPSSDPGKRYTGKNSSVTSLWPKWIWIVVPILVIIVVAGFWWAILGPSSTGETSPTAKPTQRITNKQATQGPTLQATLPPAVTSTKAVVPLATFTPTAAGATTPVAVATNTPAAMAIGAKAKVINTGGSGLNMRAGPSTSQTRVKTLADGALVEIVGGPQTADGFTWYQVKDSSGTIGWVVDQFLAAQ
ncbi:MAG: SH3 domain-containing protein [Chloroflexi bacterium]|nr:SH3 domain-containing protein [Chloroflexota bacterium]